MSEIGVIQSGQRFTLLAFMGLQLLGLNACTPFSLALSAPQSPPSPSPVSPTSDSPSFPTPASVCACDRHFNKVTALTIAPDGETLISAGEDTTIKIWDLSTNSLRHTLRGHVAPVRVIALSPDGQLLASAADANDLIPGSDRVIHIWDVQSGTLLKTFTPTDRIAALAISADRQILLAGTEHGSIQAWNLQTGQIRYTWNPSPPQPEIEHNLASLSLSTDGQTFFTTRTTWDLSDRPTAERTSDAILQQWSLETGTEIRAASYTEKDRFVDAIASPDGRTLIAGDTQGMVQAWDTATNQLLYRVDTGIGGGLQLLLSPDQKSLLIQSPRTLAVLDVATGEQQQLQSRGAAELEQPDLISAMFMLDSQQIITGNETGGIVLRSLPTLDVVQSISAGSVRMVSFADHPDGEAVTILLDRPGSLLLWDIAQSRQRPLLQLDSSWWIPRYLTPDGDALFTYSRDGSMQWWNPVSGVLERSLPPGLSRSPSSLLTSDQRFLMEWRDDAFVLRDLSTGAIAGNFPHALQPPVAVSPDRRFVVGDTAAGTLAIHALPTGQRVRSLPLNVQIRKFLFSADGKLLFGAGVRGLQAWDLDEGQSLWIQSPELIFTDLMLSRNGQTLLSAHEDGKIRVWDVATGQMLRVLEGDPIPVQWLMVANADDVVLAASVDGTMRLWNWQTGAIVQTSCITPTTLP